MLNYIKSECYRVFHSKGIYVITGVLSSLTLLVNVVLFAFSHFTPDFPYGIVRFSLNNLIGTTITFLWAGLIIATSVFNDEYKYGTLKNVVSFGITRSAFLTGKCIVSFVASLASMVVTLAVYVGSAYLMLASAESRPLLELMKGTAACLPAAFASVVLTVVLFCVYQREGIVAIQWVVIFAVIPKACSLLGLKIDVFAKVASWMPWNYLSSEVIVTWSKYDCLWNTPEGLFKCIVSGLIGIVVFYGVGIVLFRKKEIA